MVLRGCDVGVLAGGSGPAGVAEVQVGDGSQAGGRVQRAGGDRAALQLYLDFSVRHWVGGGQCAGGGQDGSGLVGREVVMVNFVSIGHFSAEACKFPFLSL